MSSTVLLPPLRISSPPALSPLSPPTAPSTASTQDGVFQDDWDQLLTLVSCWSMPRRVLGTRRRVRGFPGRLRVGRAAHWDTTWSVGGFFYSPLVVIGIVERSVSGAVTSQLVGGSWVILLCARPSRQDPCVTAPLPFLLICRCVSTLRVFVCSCAYLLVFLWLFLYAGLSYIACIRGFCYT
jgi:hypothetical protein